ncbi:TonB-dependent receptor [Fontimonas sp. SYSU GA230001]|uniref:TonB-dependent receptor n=1 Tax=Fontimonas sp. SYSU GA230001 TaxID=3142450 RepID=UPI0032B53482
MRIERIPLLLALSLAAHIAAAQPDEGSATGDAPQDPVIAVRPAPPPTRAVSTTDAVADAAALEEIVVTAERRVASVQDTPISIEAFNAETIELRGIQGVHDLSAQVPALTIEPFPTHNATLRLFIRGVGVYDAQLTQDPAVGVYLDGVYIARSVGLALDLADLDRIEVLRGPQGTLYGRNTTGGAINLITKRPDPGAFSMSAQTGGGSRSNYRAKASFNVPVTDDLALGLALLGNRRDGFVDNTGPGEDFGDRSELAGRLSARWLPTAWLTTDYSYDHSDLRYANTLFQAVLPPNTNKGQAELFKPYAVSQTVYSERRLRHLATGAPMEESGSRIDGHALTLTAPLGAFELKYIGAWRKLRDEEYADLGGGAGSTTYRLDSNAYAGPAATVANGGPTPLVIPTVTQEQFSHELQFGGRLFDDRVEFIVGAYAFRETGREDRHRLNHQLSTAISPDQLDELSASLPELDPILGSLGIIDFSQIDQLRLVNFVDFDWTIANRATALFGQATWTPPFEALQDRLHLTVGYRRSSDEREAVKFRISDTYVEVQANGQGTARLLSSAEKFDYVRSARSFRDDAWSFVAAYELTPAINLYAKSVEAYKSGGFNVRDPHISGASQGNTYGFGFVDGFAPEYVQSWEAGIKSEWLGRRLRVNADVFRSDYTDMQINFLIPGTISDTKTINAGKARMRGFELDATAQLHADLRLSADYAWLDAEVLEVIDPQGNNVADLYPFTSAPRHSGVVALDWTALRAGWGELRAYGSYNYIAQRQGNVITEERRGLTSIPAYGLWNARLSAAGIRMGSEGTLDLALWGRNLADKVYPLMAIDNLPQSDRAVVWGEPRSLGLELTYRFRR